MAYDDPIQPTTRRETISLALLATEDAVLPDPDHCAVRTSDDVGRALARGDAPDVVVLGASAPPASVTDTIRRVQDARTRTWVVCQGAQPAPASGHVTTVAAREEPRRAVERTVYLALVERHRELAVEQADATGGPTATDTTTATAATVGATRSAYAGRLDEDDYAALYRRI